MGQKDLRDKFRPYAHSTDVVDGVAETNNKIWNDSVDQCVQIAKDYAKEEAIGFAEWLILKCDYQKHGVWCYQGMEFSQPELYKIYQQQKQKL